MLVALPALCDCLVCRVLVRMENSRATKIPYHTSRSREESVLWGNHNTLSMVSGSLESRASHDSLGDIVMIFHDIVTIFY